MPARPLARPPAASSVASAYTLRERQPPGVGNDASYAHSVTNIPRDPETPARSTLAGIASSESD